MSNLTLYGPRIILQYICKPTDTQCFMIEFIHNIWWLDMFRTSMVHPQERLYNRITSGRIEQYANYHIPNSQHTACKRSWGWTIEVRNMSSHQMLWINSIIKHCVSGWFTYIYDFLVSGVERKISLMQKYIKLRNFNWGVRYVLGFTNGIVTLQESLRI